MISEELQEKLLSVVDKRFENYNTKVLEELGNVIKQFKDLTPSQAYSLAQQLKYNTTVKELLNELSKISGLSVEDLKRIYLRDNKAKLFLTEDDKKKFTSDYIDNHNVRKE